MSNCNLCWLSITTSFTKSKQTHTNKNRSASPHLLFAQPVPSSPGSCGLWPLNGKNVCWTCLSVCQLLLHLSSETWGWTTLHLIHLIPSSPVPHPQAQQLTRVWKTELTKSEDSGDGNPRHQVLWSYKEPTQNSLAPNPPPKCVCWAKIHRNLSYFKILQKYFKN